MLLSPLLSPCGVSELASRAAEQHQHQSNTAETERLWRQVRHADAVAAQEQRELAVASCFAVAPGWMRSLAADVQAAVRASGPDAVAVAADLAIQGYAAEVYGANVSSVSSSPFRIRHTLIGVQCAEPGRDDDGTFVLVDPVFREQFVVARPSESYTRLLSFVPEVFVGTRAHMIAGVRLLCPEMRASLEAAGLDVPPWRTTERMVAAITERRLPMCVSNVEMVEANMRRDCSSIFEERRAARERKERDDALDEQMKSLASCAAHGL